MNDKIYKVGDSVWIAQNEYVEERVPCYACYGKKVLTVILGNGQHIEVDCDYCSRGFTSTGHMFERGYKPIAQKVVITRCNITQDGETVSAEYRFKKDTTEYCLYADSIYDSEESAMHAAWKLEIDNAIREAERQRATRSKVSKADKLTWAVGYHRREAASHKEKMEGHLRLAREIQQQAKETK